MYSCTYSHLVHSFSWISQKPMKSRHWHFIFILYLKSRLITFEISNIYVKNGRTNFRLRRADIKLYKIFSTGSFEQERAIVSQIGSLKQKDALRMIQSKKLRSPCVHASQGCLATPSGMQFSNVLWKSAFFLRGQYVQYIAKVNKYNIKYKYTYNIKK